MFLDKKKKHRIDTKIFIVEILIISLFYNIEDMFI